jgi:hypothetical protein
MTDKPCCAFEQGENKIKAKADERGIHASLDHLVSGLRSGHTVPLSPIHLLGEQSLPVPAPIRTKSMASACQA